MSKSSCAKCGQAIPVAAPSGFCPACLLSLGLGPGVVRGPEPAPPSPLSAAPAARTGDADLEHPGLEVGRYTLRSVLGEGGFGTVWLAEQREPVRREVALKIIKRGMDTRRVVARFEAERQALALMDHPNIARVLDGGATDGGRPYFVLELVRGLPITEYCDARQLSTTDRIALFIPVCLAVQHAHQKSIIHRDLKPANILIAEEDGRAVPKVIDFGVAKAMADPLTDKTLVTHLHEFLGTPAYMSPEQAGLHGLDIDSRSDVYSLGVLLHEVLTGRPPIDPRPLSGHGIDGMLKAVRESLPSKPSTTFATLSESERRATAARRQEEPAHVGRRLRGDLDWILLKALEKDRDRRYQTANGLAADLRRHLDHESVDAHPPSYSYRFGQLARRHRVLVAAFGAVGLSLMLGLVATSWQALRATQNLALARRNAYAAEMTVAQQAIAENNLERALELLDRQRPGPGEHQGHASAPHGLSKP